MSDAEAAASTERSWAGLERVEVVSGTAENRGGSGFHGFVTVRALASDGSHMAGQLHPGELRRMALQFLEVAEAAEQDAIVMTMLVDEIELPPDAAAGFVMRMRDVRAALPEVEGDE